MGEWKIMPNLDYVEERHSKVCDECGCPWTEHDISRDWESGIEEADCPNCDKCGEGMFDHVRDGDKIICPEDDK